MFLVYLVAFYNESGGAFSICGHFKLEERSFPHFFSASGIEQFYLKHFR